MIQPSTTALLALSACLLMSGCADPTPKCPDTVATGLLGQIFAGQMRKLSGNLITEPEPEKAQLQRKYAGYLERMELPVTGIAEVSYNEKERERVCRAQIDMAQFRARSFGTRPLNPELDGLLGQTMTFEYVVAMLPGSSTQLRVDILAGPVNAYSLDFAKGLTALARSEVQTLKAAGFIPVN